MILVALQKKHTRHCHNAIHRLSNATRVEKVKSNYNFILLILPERKSFTVILLSSISLFISSLFPAGASELYFMPDALENTHTVPRNIDLSRFEHGEQMAGTYRIDIWLNNKYVLTKDISFVAMNGAGLLPELSLGMLEKLGVRIYLFPKLAALPKQTIITNIGTFIPDASTRLNFDKQRLDISIPQSALNIRAQGTVDPMRWDQGIPTLLFSYNVNGSRNRVNQGNAKDLFYLNLQSGLNLGAWRLRNYSTATKNNNGHNFSSVSTTLNRDIQFLKGQLQLGETSTTGDIFDSIMFRGIQLYSDETMQPESMRGFAPTIRGIARTNAMVTIKQNGYTIYQTYVVPGSFEIRDLYPTSTSGDLDITVTESDGSEQRFVQPISTVPVMLREGRLKYSLSGGKYRPIKDRMHSPSFGQGTLAWGVSNTLTLYGGMLGANNYLAGVLGGGLSFGEIGAFSADVTLADSKIKQDKTRRSRGTSYRVQYSKMITTTDTTVALASYRYSSEGFYTFQELNDHASQRYNKRSRQQLNLNQPLMSWGSFYISAYQQDYWLRKGYERSIITGINTSINEIAYSLSYTYSETPSVPQKDQILAFNFQIPLSKWLPKSWASYSVNAKKNGGETYQVGVSGMALTDNNLSYSLHQGYSSSGAESRSSVSGTYKGSYGTVSAGYNYSRDNSQLNASLQGGIVAHEDGVTFSQPLGDTIMLVKAEGASGLKILNNSGVKTDWRGYAIVPYASAYQENRIAIDTRSIKDNTDIAESVINVVPTRGAVVRAKFNVRTGDRALIKLLYKNEPVPFGAMVKLEGSDVISIVGNNGELYLSGLNKGEHISVSWGQINCRATIKYERRAVAIQHVAALCQ